MREDLDAAILAAHDADDKPRLISLYAQAADISEGVAASFYLTHAYVFALETGDQRAAELRAKLVALGSE